MANRGCLVLADLWIVSEARLSPIDWIEGAKWLVGGYDPLTRPHFSPEPLGQGPVPSEVVASRTCLYEVRR